MAWVYWTSTANGTSSTTSTAWNAWTSDKYYIYDTSSTMNSTRATWTSATGMTITSTPTSTVTVWSDWVFSQDEVRVGKINGVQVRPLTEEETESERERLEQLAKEERKRQEAEEKALALLKESLTEDQRAVFEETGVVPVVCRSGRKYHIRKGIAGNVHELDEKGATARRLCFHPPDCPVHDVMLAQKLLLETDEEMARGIANFS